MTIHSIAYLLEEQPFDVTAIDDFLGNPSKHHSKSLVNVNIILSLISLSKHQLATGITEGYVQLMENYHQYSKNNNTMILQLIKISDIIYMLHNGNIVK